jgi:hypothetical protein
LSAGIEAALGPNDDELILRCVDEGLSALGGGGREVIYWYLKHNRGVKLSEIAQKPREFHAALGALFGSGGSVLEKLIVMKLNSSIESTTGALTFEEAVSMARASGRRSGDPARHK